jgi:hypothetical protein
VKCKNKHALIRKFNPILNEKNYHHPIFLQYKKVINLFSLYSMKKNSIKKIKKIKRKKNKIRNLLKGKKLKGNKLVVSVLSAVLLYAIHGATI